MENKDLLLSSYEYHLPEEQIAQFPSIPAHNAKLMICSKKEDWEYLIEHKHFFNLPEILTENHLLFLNRTKVFKARIPLKDIKIIRNSWKELIIKEWEIFVYNIHDYNKFECLVSDSKNFRPWSKIFFSNNIVFNSLEFTENWILFEIDKSSNITIFDFLEKIGEMPLPPYIQYTKEKEQWYQTFFAEEIGSAAAPTASLHFTPQLVKELEEKKVWFQYLCLHVGLGTFKPVYEEHIEKQKLHFEPMIINNQIWEIIMQNKESKKIFLPVWTTMIRYLESLPYIRKYLRKNHNEILQNLDEKTKNRWDKLTNKLSDWLTEDFIPQQEIHQTSWEFVVKTRLFIRPWIQFLLVDELITNFHLPKSSLMMLISAFMWRENLLKAYNTAINNNYKFYSFWDGMYIKKA